MNKKYAPPKWAVRFFEWYCKPTIKEELEGDFNEQFEEDLRSYGPARARRKFVFNVIRYFHPAIIRKSTPGKMGKKSMFSNYLKIGWRNLIKDYTYSGLNILGLTIGISSVLVIYSYLIHELSYDRFHVNGDNIYRVAEYATQEGIPVEVSASIPIPFGNMFPQDYSQFKAVRFFQTYNREPLLSLENGEKKFYEDKLFFTDSTFFDIFSFQLIEGDGNTALDNPNSAVITESFAKKYFGSEEALGKILIIDDSVLLNVTGVLKDVPSNSHIDFEILVSFINSGAGSYNGWFWNPCYTYILAPENFPASDIQKIIDEFTISRVPENLRTDALNVAFYLQPLWDIHLNSDLYQELKANNTVWNLYFAAAIAILILIIAAVNFINLSTARAVKRSKEVGVRKSLGASRKQLIGQFLTESILVTLISTTFGLLLVKVSIPFLEIMLQTHFGSSILSGWHFFSGLLAFVLLLGLLAGAYPAFVVSGFKPTEILKSHQSSALKGSALARKSLLIVQLSISTFLILATAVVYNQRQFLSNKELGFKKDNIVMFSMNGTKLPDNFESFHSELISNASVIEASAVGQVLGENALVTRTYFEGMEEHLNIPIVAVDENFIKLFGFEVLEGDTLAGLQGEAGSKYFANQSFLNLFPGKKLDELPHLVGSRRTRNDKIVGILRDFHFYSLHEKIQPFLFRVVTPNFVSYAAVKIDPGNISESLQIIEKTARKFIGEKPLDFFFLDDRLNNMYIAEAKSSKLFAFFSLVAIVLTCLGLVSFSAYTARQRSKEICIRKVFGASLINIIGKISQNYLQMIVISSIIIIPIGWYLMHNWLENFAYHISVNWLIFVLAFLGTGALVLLSVGAQSLQLAKSNPAKILKGE